MAKSKQITIYHNPRCSKSRQTLRMLEEQGIKPTIVAYLETPPSKTELKRILKILNLQPRQLMRTKEKEYLEAGLNNPDLSREELIDAMIRYPRLIERPIVVVNDKAVLGRPPENILKIL
jgi:arsenate reductase